MPEDIYEQLLHIDSAQLTDLALAGLRRQGEMVAQAIDNVQEQLGAAPHAAEARSIYLAGCGDSYFAALSARYAFEQLTGLPTVALRSSELGHYTSLPPNSLVVVISSGGEVSATLEAGRVARQAGVEVMGVTAQQSSRMAEEFPCLVTAPGLSSSDHVDQVALMLGNFSLSLVALYLAALQIGQRRGHLHDRAARETEAEIRAIPGAIEGALSQRTQVYEYLEQVSDGADFYFLGAGPSLGVALFYQAKFFEQAQRAVYGVELEEFTHEQFLLLRPDRDAEVWFISPAGRSQQRTLEVMAGCREMGARIVAVVNSHDERVQQEAHLTLAVGATPEMFSPLVSAVPGELLGYCAFARWGSGVFSAATRRRQMAVSRQLTREE